MSPIYVPPPFFQPRPSSHYSPPLPSLVLFTPPPAPPPIFLFPCTCFTFAPLLLKDSSKTPPCPHSLFLYLYSLFTMFYSIAMTSPLLLTLNMLTSIYTPHRLPSPFSSLPSLLSSRLAPRLPILLLTFPSPLAPIMPSHFTYLPPAPQLPLFLTSLLDLPSLIDILLLMTCTTDLSSLDSVLSILCPNYELRHNEGTI